MARVLVVEDDDDVRALVVRRLQREGHRVQGADGAHEAAALIEQKGAPDIAVLDVNMPLVNGFELLGQLRTQIGRPDLPAIFLSAQMRPDDIAAGRALGAVYLTKPFVANALIKTVHDLLLAEEKAAGEPEQQW